MALPLGMTAPNTALPSVQVRVSAGMLAAGVRAVLSGAGFSLDDENGLVWVIDDAWLTDLSALAEAPALVALGSVAWSSLLPEMAAGGWAALSTDANPAELLAGILGAAAGLVVLPPHLVGLLPELDDEELDLNPADVNLTPREQDVLNLLAEGLSNKRIARELGVSESTVKFHVQAVYSKLGVQSRTAAVTRGIQTGLVRV